MKRKTKHLAKKIVVDGSSWLAVVILIFSALSVIYSPTTKGLGSSGQTRFYLNKDNSDANEAYNSTTLAPGARTQEVGPGDTPVNIQSKSQTSTGNTGSISFTGTPTAGHLLVAYVYGGCGTSGGNISVTSTGWTNGAVDGNAPGAPCGSNGEQTLISWKIANGTGDSPVNFTCNPGSLAGTCHYFVAIAEYSGIDTTHPTDDDANPTGANVSGSKANNASTQSSVNVTPNLAHKILVVGGAGVRNATSGVDTTNTTLCGVTPNFRTSQSGVDPPGGLFDATLESAGGCQNGIRYTLLDNNANSLAIFKVANTGSTTKTNGGAGGTPTSFCEASTNTTDNLNAFTINTDNSSGSTGDYCLATFLSSPFGKSLQLCKDSSGACTGGSGGGDLASITGDFYALKASTASPTATFHAVVYRWSGSGTTVSGGDKIADLSCAPSSTYVSCNPTVVQPANDVTINVGDRLAIITYMNVSALAANTNVGFFVDTSQGASGSSSVAHSYLQMGYTYSGYNLNANPVTLAGPMDDDFTTDTSSAQCSNVDGTTKYNTKWTCYEPQGNASIRSYINVGGLSGTITGDSSGWLQLVNRPSSTGITLTDFSSIGAASNVWFYQPMPSDYSSGNITTLLSVPTTYDVGWSPSHPPSPYSHVGLTLLSSFSDYYEIQVYADGSVNDSGTNKVHVVFNNSGTLDTANQVNLNSATTGNGFTNVWLRFANTNGSWQPQYSLDGSSFSNIGSTHTHDAFLKTGYDAFDGTQYLNSSSSSQTSASVDWFQSTLTSAAYNQDAYIWDTNADSTTPGTALAANNAAYNLTSPGQAFRLRLAVQITGQSNAGNSPPSFKLQYVGKGSGTCAAPSGGTPSTYTDVTSSTTGIAYNNNPTPADEDNISTASGKDPTGAGGNIAQTYQELNNFNASHTDLNNGDDGVWDFALVDNSGATPTTDQLLAGGEWFGSSTATTYCLQVVTSAGAGITYTNRPEVSTAGLGVVGKQPFFWAN